MEGVSISTSKTFRFFGVACCDNDIGVRGLDPEIRKGSGLDRGTGGVAGGVSILVAAECRDFSELAKKALKNESDSFAVYLCFSGSGDDCAVPKALANEDELEANDGGGGVGYMDVGDTWFITDCANGGGRYVEGVCVGFHAD